MRIGGWEIALIVVAIILIFGVGKLANVGGALGKSIREFRREKDRKDDDVPQSTTTASAGEKAAVKSDTGPGMKGVCPKCGQKLPEGGKFCMACGAKVGD